MLALLDSGSKIKAIYLIFPYEQGLLIRPTNVGAEKIDGNTLDIYEMVIATFLVTNKANQGRFFENTFLLANFSPKVVYRMVFFTLSSANIDFLG